MKPPEIYHGIPTRGNKVRIISPENACTGGISFAKIGEVYEIHKVTVTASLQLKGHNWYVELKDKMDNPRDWGFAPDCFELVNEEMVIEEDGSFIRKES